MLLFTSEGPQAQVNASVRALFAAGASPLVLVTDARPTSWRRRWRGPSPILVAPGTSLRHLLDLTPEGEFVAVARPALFAPDALALLLEAAEGAEGDVCYGDHDSVTKDGARHSPDFKPAWNPDLLLSRMYLGPVVLYRRSILDMIAREENNLVGDPTYDLVLRATEHSDRVLHVPRVLSHLTDPDVPDEAGRASLEATLARRGIAGHVMLDQEAGGYHVRRERRGEPLISILIPVRDGLPLLQRCIESIQARTTYRRYEIIILDNDSGEAETQAYLQTCAHRVLPVPGPFNYAAINNRGVDAARGEYVVLLNSDTEVLSPDWLQAMLEHATRPEVGAVGARLLFPDGTLQHAGVVLGVGGVAGHAFKGVEDRPGAAYGAYPHLVRNYSAVTGACLMVRRDLYQRLGGMDAQHLAVSYNDVDLCLRLGVAGFRTVYTPHCVLIHHEGATRRDTVLRDEAEWMESQWGGMILMDPAYHPMLTRSREDFAPDLGTPEGTVGVWRQHPLKGDDERVLGEHEYQSQVEVPFQELAGLAIRFATYTGRCDGQVRLRIQESGQTEKCTVTIDASIIGDNRYTPIAVPALPVSSGSIALALSFYPNAQSAPLALWTDSDEQSDVRAFGGPVPARDGRVKIGSGQEGRHIGPALWDGVAFACASES